MRIKINILSKDVISTYASRLWTILFLYIFTPVYIRIFGIEAFGIINFYNLLFALVFFLESGLSSTITKELANVSTSKHYKKAVYGIIEKYFFIVCIAIGILIFFSAKLIAEFWLKIPKDNIGNVSVYIKIMGIIICFQLFSTYLNGALLGLGYQFKANIYQLLTNVFKNVGILLFSFFARSITLDLFFYWQLVCTLLYVIFLRINIFKALGKHLSTEKEKIKLPTHIWKYLKGMILISLLSAITLQADKIFVSHYFSLSIFGFYSLASTVSQIPYIICSPVAITLFPKIVSYHSENAMHNIRKLYVQYSFLISTLCFTSLSIIILFSNEILHLLTQKQFQQSTSLVTKLLTVGWIFMVLQLIPYYVILATGKLKYTIIQTVIQASTILPLYYIFISNNGLIGVSIPWIIINIAGYCYITIVSKKIVFSNNNTLFNFFLIKSIAIPLLVSMIITGIAFCFTYSIELISTIKFLVASTIIALTIFTLAFYFFNKKNKYAKFLR